MKLELRKIDPAEVMSTTNWNNLMPGHDSMVKYLKDIFEILKPNIDDAVLNHKCYSGPIESRETFSRLTERFIAEIEKHPEIGYELKRKGSKYYIEIGMCPNIVPDRLYAMPMSWMAKLYHRNRSLFRLAAHVFYKIMTEKGLYLNENFMEDMICCDSQSWLESLDNPEEEEATTLELEVYSEKSNELTKLIYQKTNRFKSDSEFLKALESFEKQDIQNYSVPVAAILDVIKALYKASNEPGNVNWISEEAFYNEAVRQEAMEKDSDGTEYPEFPDGEPLRLSNQVTLVWSNNEHFIEELISWVSSTGNNFGNAFPYDERVIDEPTILSDVIKTFRKDKGYYLIEHICDAMEIFASNEESIYLYCYEKKSNRSIKSREVCPEESSALL